MIQFQNKFYSCVDTRIQSQGEMYARFHLGTFFRGQALTVANALRRTLLGEIPCLVVTRVEIDGVTHEFSTLPGIQESVLDILLNLKRLTFTISNKKFNLFRTSSLKTKVFLKIRGPAKVTAADLKLPTQLSCVWHNQYIATLSSNAELACVLELAVVHPKFLILEQNQNQFFQLDQKNKFLSRGGDFSLSLKEKESYLSKKDTDTESSILKIEKDSSLSKKEKKLSLSKTEKDSSLSSKESQVKNEAISLTPNDKNSSDEKNKKIFYLETNSSPVRKVNYVINELDTKKESEYIVFEIVTDGSIEPKEALRFAFKQLTKLFYDFTQISKQKNINRFTN